MNTDKKPAVDELFGMWADDVGSDDVNAYVRTMRKGRFAEEENMNQSPSPRMTRAWNEMPDTVRDALLERDLMAAYRNRPPYQQNDYIGWITRAKRQATKDKRLAQMLDELEQGDVYMKMAYRPKN